MAINFAVQEKPSLLSALLLVIAGAMMTCVMLMSSQALGPLAVILNLALPLPIAYVGMRSGFCAALASLIIVFVVDVQLSTMNHGLFYVVQFGSASVVLPKLLRLGVGWFKSIGVCLALTSSIVFVCSWGYASLTDTTIPSIVSSYVSSEVDGARQVYQNAELAPEQMEELLAVLDTTAIFIQQAYVGLSIVSFAAVLIVTILLLSVVARGRYVISGGLFHDLHLPEWLIWFLIVSGFSLLIDFSVMQQIAINVLTVILPLYLLQGVAIMTFFFRKKAFSTLARVFGYVLILVINPLPLLVTAIGVFDMWFDFRKPRAKTT